MQNPSALSMESGGGHGRIAKPSARATRRVAGQRGSRRVIKETPIREALRRGAAAPGVLGPFSVNGGGSLDREVGSGDARFDPGRGRIERYINLS
ncbi:hypothetical protein EVAR_56605_1 [Eumeta japonica]|uniref:Uncharacterized protein n=1 Tax=Eumeta variegata TaxID=151549 RepID=A0A4C1Z1N8_EUMVA|nr:hypothetical protein EVAR_56605_1 [Eumeta japonica]